MSQRFTIRPGDLSRDRAHMLSFIDGLQAFEFKFEPDRRLDGAVAAEHLEKLLKEIAEHGGAMFVAEAADGTAVGWSVVHAQDSPLFIVAEARRHAYIAELYLDESARGGGTGSALIAACEDWARSRGLGLIRIGVLARNFHAHEVYRRAGYRDYAVELCKILG